MKARWWSLGTTLLVTLAVGTWPAGRSPSAQVTRLRIGETFALNHVHLYAGLQRGVFQRHGLAVERVSLPGGAKALTALLSGDVDLADVSTVNVLRAQVEGRAVRILGATYTREFWAVVVTERLRAHVASLADLRGRTLGVSTIGSGSWGFANVAAKRAGLDPARDVQIVPLGNITAMVAAVRAGKVDAAVTFEPGTTRVLHDRIGYALVDLLDPVQHRQFMGSDESLVEVVAARDEFVKANGDALRRFFAALNESAAWVHSATVDEIARTIAPITEEAPSAALNEAVRRSIPGVPRTAVASEAAYTVAVGALREAGAIKEAIPFERAVDNTFAGAR